MIASGILSLGMFYARWEICVGDGFQCRPHPVVSCSGTEAGGKRCGSRRDSQTGLLTDTHQDILLSRPVCVQFY